ncbi:hypothetical protein ACPWT1_12535 [Ramlibacter sp. MMS24-I3-19]|uniref:hypothetical protein n=1 Tax=Ramlibacter sp. MMS24-I3-19 TaxID=3416606 RepID=UPI003CFE723B
MFKIFQRKPAPAPALAKAAAERRTVRRTGPAPFERPAVPQAQELDDESAWDQWEHSQMELDSRLGPLSAFDSVRVKGGTPSQAAELDPFASVRQRRKP